MAKKAILMDPRDNVATMLSDVEQGELVSAISKAGDVVKKVVAKNPILVTHKIALESITTDAEIIKYGEVIGVATKDIQIGEHVHVQNVVSRIMR